jgi:hypothetical protein
MKFFQLIKGDIYAGFRVPGVAIAVKNLAYLCVKLQAEIGGDEQILKYNGIGGIQNTTPIPLKTYINSLVEKYKSSIGAIVAELPDATMVARYDSRYQRTASEALDVVAQTLLTCSRATGCCTVSDALHVVGLILLSCSRAKGCCSLYKQTVEVLDKLLIKGRKDLLTISLMAFRRSIQIYNNFMDYNAPLG